MKRAAIRTCWPTFVVFFVILVIPAFLHTPYYLTNMVTAGAYAIIALATGLVMGQAGLLTFGTAAFAGIGAYTTAILVYKYHWPTLAAVLAGVALSAAIGLIIGKPVLRFRMFFLALATMGVGTIFTVIINNWRSITMGSTGIAGLPYLSIAGFSFSSFISQYYFMWVVILLLAIFTQSFLRTRVGRALLALNSNETAAQTLGIHTSAWKLRVFVASCVYSALGGSIWVLFLTSVGPSQFSTWTSVVAMLMVMVGGQYSVLGSIVGAILITWLGIGLTTYAEYSSGIYSVILILLIIFLPGGLAGLMRSGKLLGLRDGLVRYLRLAEWRARFRSESDTPVAIPAATVTPAMDAPSTSLSTLPSSAQVESTSASVFDSATSHRQGRNGALVFRQAAPDATDLASDQPDGSRLKVMGVTVNFGGLHAVNNVSLNVPKGLISAVIGPNGAGKTTLFNVITGLQRPTAGEVWFEGKSITHMNPANIARLGMARTFQNLRLFANMNVIDNVMVGRHRHEKSHFVAAGLRLPGSRREERKSRELGMELLSLLGIADRAYMPATSLPYGQQRLVEIARALASEPSLLLLDEPAAGMNTSEREVLMEKILEIYRAGIDVLIVEHDMDLIMGISHSVAVLEHGSLIANGTPAEVQCNPAVIKAYLGTKEHLADDMAKEHVRVAVHSESASASQESSSTKRPVLAVEDVSTFYGSIGAVRNVSLEVYPGEIMAVLGANGAGKTTLLHTISGALRAQAGRVVFEGRDITRLFPPDIAHLGMTEVPEGRHVFPTLTVFDNLQLGAGKVYKGPEFRSRLESVYELFPVLAERRKQLAGSLSGGEQQMLAIGRALMSGPRLLLLDEPSMGLAPLVVAAILETLVKLNQEGLTMLMVEQNAEAALTIANRAIVMVTGRVALRGTAEEVRNAPNLRELYLGDAECDDELRGELAEE